MTFALPGDPPLPELGLLFFGVASLFLASLAALRRLSGSPRRSRALPRLAVASLIVAVGCLLPVASRHFGSWGHLKQELAGYADAARAYEAERGRISNNLAADGFYRSNPHRRFSLGEPGPVVEIVYLWWLEPPTVGIVWGNGRAAAFHQPTMACVYSD